LFLWVGQPPRKWAGPQRSLISGIPFYLYTHPLTQNYTKSDMVTHVRRGLF